MVCERGIMEDVVRDWRRKAAGEQPEVTLSPTGLGSDASSPAGFRSPTRPHLMLTVPEAVATDTTSPRQGSPATPRGTPSGGGMTPGGPEVRIARSFMGTTGSFTK